MKLIYYPNPLLDTTCEPVTEFNDELKSTIEQMKSIMLANNGIGLSANQCGILKQIFIMKDTKGIIHEFINPKILDSSGLIMMDEGCLSTPSLFLPISRPEYVTIEAANVLGERRAFATEGIDARCLQHEYDHLFGIFFLSKVSRKLRKTLMSKLK